ncbi:hypothetical protein CPER28S_02594 [Cellulomonas persica]
MIRPARAAASTLRFVFGDAGYLGGTAWSTIVARMDAVPAVVVGDTSAITLVSSRATAFAMSAAACGELLLAAMLRIDVPFAVVAEIRPASDRAVVLRPRSSTTGSSTIGSVASCANESICACV